MATRCQCFLTRNGRRSLFNISTGSGSLQRMWKVWQGLLSSGSLQVNPGPDSASSKHPRGRWVDLWAQRCRTHVLPLNTDLTDGLRVRFRIGFGSFVSFIAFWHALSCLMWKVCCPTEALMCVFTAAWLFMRESELFFLPVLDGLLLIKQKQIAVICQKFISQIKALLLNWLGLYIDSTQFASHWRLNYCTINFIFFSWCKHSVVGLCELTGATWNISI